MNSMYNYEEDDRFKMDETFFQEDEPSTVRTGPPSKKPKKSVTFDEKCPFKRFDPFNPEHVAWVKRNNKKDDEEESVDEDEKNNSTTKVLPATIVDDRRFYNIDADFMNELREKTAQNKKESFDIFKKPEIKAVKDEPQVTKIEKKVNKAPKISTVKRSMSGPTFFFHAGDPEIKKKLQRYSIGTEKSGRHKWNSFRLAFWKNAKNMRKHRLRELEEKEKKSRAVAVKK